MRGAHPWPIFSFFRYRRKGSPSLTTVRRRSSTSASVTFRRVRAAGTACVCGCSACAVGCCWLPVGLGLGWAVGMVICGAGVVVFTVTSMASGGGLAAFEGTPAAHTAAVIATGAALGNWAAALHAMALALTFTSMVVFCSETLQAAVYGGGGGSSGSLGDLGIGIGAGAG